VCAKPYMDADEYHLMKESKAVAKYRVAALTNTAGRMEALRSSAKVIVLQFLKEVG
jgi:hypothetical protein